ncbi:prepilin-type N-terminal cleavage/methylation domain-containing protein [Caminibacter sp.]
MRTRSSFTLIELIIVIIIIGILVFSINFNFFNPNLNVAADKILRDLRFTQSLGLKDDKYYPFPDKNDSVDMNKSKYWFKQWWQLRISRDSNGNYSYEIFSDSAHSTQSSNFDRIANPVSEFALNPLNAKRISGTGSASMYSVSEYNLSKYNIKLIIKPDGHPFNTSNTSVRFLFDNFGNVFLSEGSAGDAGDINPLDQNYRPLIVKTENIKLCLDNPCQTTNKNRCIQINITPTGYVYKSNCN